MGVFILKIHPHLTVEVQFLRFVELGDRLMIQSLVHLSGTFHAKVMVPRWLVLLHTFDQFLGFISQLCIPWPAKPWL
jgi:hypothetical protein